MKDYMLLLICCERNNSISEKAELGSSMMKITSEELKTTSEYTQKGRQRKN